MLIKEIEQLGKKVASLWEKEKDKTAFSKIATTALKESQIHKHFSFEKFLQELWQTKELPQQLALYNSFGHPPITFYRDDNFLIDIYFWVAPDISVHSHCFEGAFTVLQGLSLQSQYRFDVAEDLDDEMFLGDLILQHTKLIQVGEVQEILKGPEFIHQVWHLSYPTVSLAIRTLGNEKVKTQRTYSKPHLSFYSHRPLSPILQKQLDTLLMLRRIHRSEEPHLLKVVSLLEPGLAFKFLHAYYNVLGEPPLIERVIANLPKLEKWATPFLTTLKHETETAFDMIEIPDLGERLLIAILNISTTREQSEALFDMVFPGQSFEENVIKWFKALLGKKALRLEFNETAQDVFAYLFQGYSDDQIYEKLSAHYEIENDENFKSDIRQCLDELTSSDLLKPLLPKFRILTSSSPSKGDGRLQALRAEKTASTVIDELFLRPLEPQIPATAAVMADQESMSFFNAKGYWVLRNVISPQALRIFSNYFFFREKNASDFSSDDQVKGSKGRYADPLCESLLLEVQPLLEKATGKSLLPTYSYTRIYGPGQILEKHKDRPSCEISATLTIAYDAPNLWPVFVESDGQVVKVELDKGDLLIYKGCDVSHWREPFEGKVWLQTFLHFVDRNGKFAEWQYDKRKNLGESFTTKSGVYGNQI